MSGDPGHPQLRHIPSKPATPGSQGEVEGMGQVLGGGGLLHGRHPGPGGTGHLRW